MFKIFDSFSGQNELKEQFQKFRRKRWKENGKHICRQCMEYPIPPENPRFKCRVCPDYWVCESCHEKREDWRFPHNQLHIFSKYLAISEKKVDEYKDAVKGIKVRVKGMKEGDLDRISTKYLHENCPGITSIISGDFEKL